MRNINEINKMLMLRKMAYVLPEKKNDSLMKLKNSIIVSFSQYLEKLGFNLTKRKTHFLKLITLNYGYVHKTDLYQCFFIIVLENNTLYY